ncbi:MAG: hypothetical protein PWQ55_1035 [Chloroflexota bacterium]|nr:hypothetical protein [Chloroflexota bacterium]
MRIATSLLMLPLFCLIVIILTGILIWMVVKRGNRTVQDYLENQESSPHEPGKAGTGANTRWARGDLLSPSSTKPAAEPATTCPACGAENPAGASQCASCGQPLP